MALSGLRNICIPKETKEKLCEMGVVDAAVANLGHKDEAILGVAVTVLRTIVTGNEKVAALVLSKTKSIPTSAIEKNQIEIGRLVYQLSKLKQKDDNLVSENAFDAIHKLLEANHRILRVEGCLALHFLLEAAEQRSEGEHNELKQKLRDKHSPIINCLERLACINPIDAMRKTRYLVEHINFLESMVIHLSLPSTMSLHNEAKQFQDANYEDISHAETNATSISQLLLTALGISFSPPISAIDE